MNEVKGQFLFSGSRVSSKVKYQEVRIDIRKRDEGEFKLVNY